MRDLTPGRWQRIDQLFEAALDQPPGRRLEWLARACEGDAALYDAVVRLLSKVETAEKALGESVTDYADTLLASLGRETAGAAGDDGPLPSGGRVGAYRLLGVIGRGGMGTVYLAQRDDAEFEKRVALKLVRRGMDTDDILLRFRYERQILASLEHPNIARLYDGGATADGRPYLVMEYIEGVSITRHCDEARLSIDARLRLFADVCRAVQFAHQNLVVHRDIKPSNILVQPDGTVKLLDFGIAKLLDPAVAGPAPKTRTGLRVFTPEYAAPEQHTGEAVTTAADVYSLGVLLFELLTGRRPQRMPDAARPSAALGRGAAGSSDAAAADSLEEIARRRGTTPERLRRRLRGDLDSIVATALAREPARRYASAGHLLADVERHLAGFPVEARGASLRYRAASFVRRHRVGVAAAAAVVLSLFGGLGAALWQAGRAARERDEARIERARAEQVAGFVLGLFAAADPLMQERLDTLRARDLVARGVERVRTELADQPDVKARTLATLGNVYMHLGLYDQARELFEEVLATARPSSGLPRERALALASLAQLAGWRGDYVAGDSLGARVLAAYAEHGWEHDTLYADVLSWRGIALGMLGRRAEAEAHHAEALTLARRWEPGGGKQTSNLLNNIATYYANIDEHARAEPLLLEVIEIDRKLYGPGHPQLAIAYNNLASSIHYQGRRTEAEPYYRQALATARRVYGPDHPHVAQFAENLATLLDDLGRYDEAEPYYRDALRILTSRLDPADTRLAMLRRNLALNRDAVGVYQEAEQLLRASVAALEATLGADHLYTALARASLGRTLTAAGRAPEGLALLRTSLAVLEGQLPDGHWRLQVVRSDLGAALAATGDVAAGERLLLDSHAALLVDRGADDYSTRDARANLARFYRARGQPELAAEYERPERRRPSR
ncbi:MAG TPA: serine/threonine-protein kinase [Longimicrobiales bacterium]